MERLFIAIDLLPEIKGEISDFCKKFQKNNYPGIKWVEKENLHITLLFLGDTSEDDKRLLIERLKEIADEFQPFQLRIENKGFFPNSREPRVVWLGITDTEKNLLRIYSKMTESFEFLKNKSFKENKSFIPHLTVARIKNIKYEILKKFVDSFILSQLKSTDFLVDGLTLFKSTLTRNGAVYEIIKHFNLKYAKDT